MKLYSFRLSGHSHRVRLFLSILGIDYDLVEIDVKAREQKSPTMLKLNPFGQVPVLVDRDEIIPDSTAILVYIAKKYGAKDWLPESPAAAAAVQRWLSVASGEIAAGPATARSIVMLKLDRDAQDAIARAHAVLAQIDRALKGRPWIACARPTIADLALYSYIVNAPEGNVDIGSYQRVRDWLERIEALRGFVPFDPSPIGLRARAPA